MAELHPKPSPFKAGSKAVSAGALNKIVSAMIRQITGGAGINVAKFGDRIVISLADLQEGRVGSSALVTITAINDTYLECDKDGASIKVARPWGLRKGVDFPTGPIYTYDNEESQHRTATGGGQTEEQFITPLYQVGEEILARRLPSTRIETEGEESEMICWVDENIVGRCWAAEDEEEVVE